MKAKCLGNFVLVVFLYLGTSFLPAWGRSVNCTWLEVTEDVQGGQEQIDGYHIYYGTTQGGPYPDGVSTGNVLEIQIDGLTGGTTYYFRASAIDTSGNESEQSLEEVSCDVPVDEVCDNLLDDDSDGLTDCQDSECGDSPEACDGFDNDCDDSTDEDLTAPACALNAGVCADSNQVCAGASGWVECDASVYGADYQADESRCDQLDNDCDGSTDEDCPCSVGETQDCSTDEGECLAGIQECDQNGSWGSCSGVLPTSEVCDGLDNDCDSETDESLTSDACPLQMGVGAGTSIPCNGATGWGEGETVYGADYVADESEVCDGLDNDCDGSTDEGCPCAAGDTQACSTDEGECQAGTQECDQSGVWGDCSGVLPGDEVCDDLDNDCDGETDEDNVCGEEDGGSSTDGGGGGSGIQGSCSCATHSGTASLFLLLLVPMGLRRRR